MMAENTGQSGTSPSASTGPYPKKRNRSDDRGVATDDTGNQASSSASTSEITEAFSSFRDEIDDHNDRRERLIKVSRDVTSLSKKVIFLLHRFDIKHFASEEPSNKTRKLFSDAEAKLEEIIAILRKAAVSEALGSTDTTEQHESTSTQTLRAQRYEQNIGGGLEEFIEAISFYHYLRTSELITLQQIQDRFRGLPVSESQFYPQPTQSSQDVPQPIADLQSIALHVPIHRYLLGLSDLTGELMRFATNAVGQGDTGAVVKQVLSLTRQLRDALDPFIPLVRDLKKKQIVTNQSLRKIEDILYAITVRSAEYGSDPTALQEMVRRTLASASSAANQGHDDDD